MRACARAWVSRIIIIITMCVCVYLPPTSARPALLPPPRSITPTWSWSAPSYRRRPRRSCAFDSSHPSVLRKSMPCCGRSTQSARLLRFVLDIIVLLLIRTSPRSGTARTFRHHSCHADGDDEFVTKIIHLPVPTAALAVVLTCEHGVLVTPILPKHLTLNTLLWCYVLIQYYLDTVH